jgi:hypothetical protein
MANKSFQYGNIPKAKTKEEADNLNRMFRTSDHERWQQMDFVVGIEIKRSNNCNSECAICKAGAGKYPKKFKWQGWHPLCRCYVISILKTSEEMKVDRERIMNGEEPTTRSVNTVKDMPPSLIDYVSYHLECKSEEWYLDNIDMFK